MMKGANTLLHFSSSSFSSCMDWHLQCAGTKLPDIYTKVFLRGVCVYLTEDTLYGCYRNTFVKHMRCEAVPQNMNSVVLYRIERDTGFSHMLYQDIVKVCQ